MTFQCVANLEFMWRVAEASYTDYYYESYMAHVDIEFILKISSGSQ